LKNAPYIMAITKPISEYDSSTTDTTITVIIADTEDDTIPDPVLITLSTPKENNEINDKNDHTTKLWKQQQLPRLQPNSCPLLTNFPTLKGPKTNTCKLTGLTVQKTTLIKKHPYQHFVKTSL
jgi:hypothetical protein